MIDLQPTRPRIRIALADNSQRPDIYRMRHEVYADELAQHPPNELRRLSDDLDGDNVYITAMTGDELCGFVSITPPSSQRAAFSIDKYVRREDVRLQFDHKLFEVRLLTVSPEYRHSPAAGLLMWAALRWIEAHGGDQIVAIGRREVMDLYRRIGLEPMGIKVRSGAVSFELMSASVDGLRRRAERFRDPLRKIQPRIDWQIGVPFQPPAPCYHGGAFFDAIGPRFESLDRRHQVISADVLDAWFDPSPRVLEALRQHLPWLARTSPPTGCEGMVAAIAEHHGVEPDRVLCGGGSSDLIFMALRQWIHPEMRALILDPMYGEYAHVLEQVIGCRVDRLTLSRERNYDVDLDELSHRIARGYDLVVLVNPNSPTGRHIDHDRLRSALLSLPPTTRLWLDETYVDYVGAEQSLAPFAAQSPNTVVCKSMSKVYALSGLRAAYLIGPGPLIEALRPLSPPWAVSLPAQVAAVEALADGAYYRARYRETHALRDALAGELRSLGWNVTPGVANFLLCHLPPAGPAAAKVVAACRQRDLFLRDASATGRGLGDRAIRIAIKDAATNSRMMSIIQEVMPTISA